MGFSFLSSHASTSTAPMPIQRSQCVVAAISRCGRKYVFVALASLLFFLTASVVINFFSMFLEPLGSEYGCDARQKYGDFVNVYIPGAGFSGFFYTMGRLQSFHNTNHEFYCFSAGCLALVASLLNQPADTALELADSSRNRWMMGEISRYDVVEDFVDGLMTSVVNQFQLLDRETNVTIGGKEEECDKYQVNLTQNVDIHTEQYSLNRHKDNLQGFLPRINVVTSTWTKGNILSQSIQKPANVEHLRKLLIQTTWIPYITGSSLGMMDKKRDHFVYHNDGAFAGLFKSFISQSDSELLFSPCQHHYSMLLPWSFDLLSNSLNILLSYDRAVHFWEEGLKRGIR